MVFEDSKRGGNVRGFIKQDKGKVANGIYAKGEKGGKKRKEEKIGFEGKEMERRKF